MNGFKRYIYFVFIASLTLMYACSDEGTLSPSGNYSVVRFSFPQGNNTWDNDIKQIHDTYGVYLLYREINEKDLNKSWTAVPTGNLYYGDSLNAEQVTYYVDFFKNNFFNYLTPKFAQKSMPVKIYMLDNLRSVPRDSLEYDKKDSTGYSKYFVNTRLDGFDYWAVSFKNSEIRDTNSVDREGVSLRKIKRCAFLYKLFVNALNNGDLVEPSEFGEAMDYKTQINTENPDAANYYLRRGFIDYLTTDFQFDRNGKRVYTSKYISYWGSSQTIEKEVGAHRDFMVYIRSAMFYTKEQFFAMYDPETYPLIESKYEIVTDYFKNTVGIDLEKIAK